MHKLNYEARFMRLVAQLLNTVIVLSVLLLPVTTQAEERAYAFVGENNRYGPGAVTTGGGYFIFDPDLRPYFYRKAAGDVDFGLYDLGGASGTIDDNLLDNNVGPENPHWSELKPIPIRGVEGFVGTLGYPKPGRASLSFADSGETKGEFSSTSGYENASPDKPLSQVFEEYVFSDDPWHRGYVNYNYNETRQMAMGPLVSRQFTAVDVFADPQTLKSIDPQTVAGGFGISATFAPHITVEGVAVPIRLDDMARLFGVDHFNWVQKVSFPSEWSAAISSDTLSSPASQPVTDPNTTPGTHYTLTNSLLQTAYVVTSFTPDSFDFYFNEQTGDAADVSNFTDEYALTFHDMPSLPIEFNPLLLDMTFTTELVGVVDGSNVEKKTGLGFTWKSNSVSIGPPGFPVTVPVGGSVNSLALLSVIDPSSSPALVGGGISEIQLLAPEPSGAVIALSGILLLTVFASANLRLAVAAKKYRGR